MLLNGSERRYTAGIWAQQRNKNKQPTASSVIPEYCSTQICPIAKAIIAKRTGINDVRRSHVKFASQYADKRRPLVTWRCLAY